MGIKKTDLQRSVCGGWIGLDYCCQDPDCDEANSRQNGAQNIFNHISGVNR